MVILGSQTSAVMGCVLALSALLMIIVATQKAALENDYFECSDASEFPNSFSIIAKILSKSSRIASSAKIGLGGLT